MKQKNTRRHVLIIEGNPDGHRLHYVAILVRETLEAGSTVTVGTSSSAVRSEEWHMYLGEFASQISTIELAEFSVQEIQIAAARLCVDHVVVPDGDSFAYALAKPRAWSGPATVSALVMRPVGQPSRIPGVAGLKTALKRSLLLLANSQRNVRIRILRSSTWQGSSAIPALCDPVSISSFEHGEPVLSKEKYGRRYWFGVVGVVGLRKNLHLIAEALSHLDCSNIGLVVAGRIQPGVLQAAQEHLQRVSEAGGIVLTVDRLLEDQELDQLIADLDCVVLAHSNEGSSGVFGKAVALGTRVIASGAKSLKADCRRISSGTEWVPLDAGHIRGAIVRATGSIPPHPVVIASPSDFAAGLLQ